MIGATTNTMTLANFGYLSHNLKAMNGEEEDR